MTVPVGKTGKVKKGPLKGWFIKVSCTDTPKGFLVARARNEEMDQTLILDGIFHEEAKLEAFFEAQAPEVNWLP